MRRLKIMQEDPISFNELFGMNDLQNRLKMFCKDQGLDVLYGVCCIDASEWKRQMGGV